MTVKRLCRAASISLGIAAGASSSWAGDDVPVISRQISDFRIGSSKLRPALFFIGVISKSDRPESLPLTSRSMLPVSH
ncbi:hypothetical protein AB9E26_35795, partial [Rhizobium leguminosarum]